MIFLDVAPLLDADPRVVQCRLLLITHAHQTHRPTGDLTFLKLSYYDFLLRSPRALEQVLEQERGGRNLSRLDFEDFERKSIESRLLPLRFEPWNNEYRLVMSTLTAMGLVRIEMSDRSEHAWRVQLSDIGTSLAQQLLAADVFVPIWKRAEIITKTFDVTLRTLSTYISRSVPETVTLLQRGSRTE